MKKRRQRDDAVKYLVTGGAGFIGSHLCERLLAEGHDVVVIDDLSTGRLDNVKHLEGDRRFDYVLESMQNESLLANILDDVDAVFHLASGVGVMSVVESPVHTIEATLYTTELLLNLASQQDKKVLITSSSEVYGKGTRVPFHEEDDLLFGPTVKSRWSYGCCKAVDEFLALAHHKQMKLPVVITRLFNTVGPRQLGKYGMVLPRFVTQAIRGEVITVFGDGEQSRCFVDVSDTVDALYKLMHSDDANGLVINVGSDEEISINGLADRVRERVNPDVDIVHVPYEQAYEEGFEDLRRRVPDVRRIRGLIGFEPTYSLDQIIDRVAEHLQTQEDRLNEL